MYYFNFTIYSLFIMLFNIWYNEDIDIDIRFTLKIWLSFIVIIQIIEIGYINLSITVMLFYKKKKKKKYMKIKYLKSFLLILKNYIMSFEDEMTSNSTHSRW